MHSGLTNPSMATTRRQVRQSRASVYRATEPHLAGPQWMMILMSILGRPWVVSVGPAGEGTFTSSLAACSVFLKYSKPLAANPLSFTSKKLCGLLKLWDTQGRGRDEPKHSAGAVNLQCQLCHILARLGFKLRKTDTLALV